MKEAVFRVVRGQQTQSQTWREGMLKQDNRKEWIEKILSDAKNEDDAMQKLASVFDPEHHQITVSFAGVFRVATVNNRFGTPVTVRLDMSAANEPPTDTPSKTEEDELQNAPVANWLGTIGIA